jgi:hypothetical protein
VVPLDRVSVKAAALAAYAELVLHQARATLAHSDAALVGEGAPNVRTVDALLALQTHADPLVRANVALVCG